MFSIAQKKSKSNCDAEQKFTNVNGESCAISQICMDCHSVCNAGMHETIANLRGFGRMRDQMAAEVLSGSNEKALDILRTCGCNIFIPGTIFTTVSEFAKFYGVTTQYIFTVLNRLGITAKKTPNDCTRGNFEDFAYHNGVLERFSLSSRYQEYILCDKMSHRQMTFQHSKNGNFYSARVVLAFAAMMYYGKSIHPDAVGNKVYETLCKSTYFDAAQTEVAKQAEIRQKKNVAAVLDDHQNTEEVQQEDGATINDDGKVVMTPEFFAGIIKTAIREAVAEFFKSAAVPAAEFPASPAPVSKSKVKYNSNGRPIKLVKPDNWDAVLAKYAAGGMTKNDAASEAGMSVSSFDNYRKGRRQFLS